MKTWTDIESAALMDPILYQMVKLVDRGDLTREQALIVVALGFSRWRKELQEMTISSLRAAEAAKDVEAVTVAELDNDADLAEKIRVRRKERDMARRLL